MAKEAFKTPCPPHSQPTGYIQPDRSPTAATATSPRTPAPQAATPAQNTPSISPRPCPHRAPTSAPPPWEPSSPTQPDCAVEAPNPNTHRCECGQLCISPVPGLGTPACAWTCIQAHTYVQCVYICVHTRHTHMERGMLMKGRSSSPRPESSDSGV